ncbi:hypothetical protein N7472_002848 [Penicillium cf. griseofulvum]|uniref:Exonuclease domain-containing protein n=1 Tax=Penicillium cf. griseofulvum TaxID=2972120 RepID=A0A9W9MS44_9EURO|nr:hypothetical protein N7472_002848 [Penicillium cf. griseofulvum]
MSSATHQKGEDRENIPLGTHRLGKIDPPLWYRRIKKPANVAAPCWERRTTRANPHANPQTTEGHTRPKDPNLGPFPDLPRIVWTEDYWTRLWDRVIIPEAKRGYQMEQMSSSNKERCQQCRLPMWGKRRQELLKTDSKIRQPANAEERRAAEKADEPKVGEVKEFIFDELTDEFTGKILWTAESIAKWRKRRAAKERKREVQYGCWGHLGKPMGKWQRFSCCGRNIFSRPCHQFKEHKIVDDEVAWKRNWELHEAPGFPLDYRYAVALDCEMGITDLGEQELIRVSAVDYFTGEILLDKLVFPKVRMFHTNLRFSGVNWNILYAAKNAGKALDGRDAAREQLFRYIGPNTVLVLHGGRADLLALRIIHHCIVDTMRFAEASLQENAKECLGRDIQQGEGHDSLEDALACRDIAHHYIKNLPFDHIYGPKYGQMWRGKILALEKPMKNGKVDPEWRPPPSKDRVPYLSSYRPFEPWVLQEERLKAENLSADEVAAREWEQQGWEWPGRLISYMDCYQYRDDCPTPHHDKRWGRPEDSWSNINPDWTPVPYDEAWDEPKGGCDEAQHDWTPIPHDGTWDEPKGGWNGQPEPDWGSRRQDEPEDDWPEQPQSNCGTDGW